MIEPFPMKARGVMATSESLGRIYEDIGALKAIAASINEKMDEGRAEFQRIREAFKNVREDQAATKACITQIKADADARTEVMERIEAKLEALEKKVNPLVALRYQLSGGAIILTAVASFAYNLFQVLEHFVTWTINPPK